jgi:dTDP-4-amino-4,6-dideoxygalactose transaminase
MKIPFNKPYFTGNELKNIKKAIVNGHISGNGNFTRNCTTFFETKYNFLKCLLTTSCTDALEMAAILLNIKQGDEIIAPSYTFVSTVNAFVLRGAKIIFVDCHSSHPCMNEDLIEDLITKNTKVILPVHYAGVACNMDKIMSIAEKHNLFVVEDAAQAIDSYYINNKGEKKPLGSIGNLGVFSFHETKNIISGEGGLLAINDPKYIERAEIILEKGTNRSQFFRGEVDKYNWVDIGSSFLMSDINAAFLWGQLEKLDDIQKKRNEIWNNYYLNLKEWANKNEVELPFIPNYATNNSHMFYLVFKSLKSRTLFISFLNKQNINSVFHYQSLNKSPFYIKNNNEIDLIYSDLYTDRLVRLPFYYELDCNKVVTKILQFNERIIESEHS